jgi:uncharacterized protein DUF1566
MCKKESYVVSASIVVAVVAMMLFFPVTGTAGILDPTAAPAPTMKTLDQIPPTWSQKLQCDTNTCPRFELVLDGAAVLDKETGLVWEKSPSSSLSIWTDAVYSCQTSTVGKRMGWRLPAVEELATLVDRSGSPDLTLPSGHPFTNVQPYAYWSASTYVADTTNALGVLFNLGTVSPHDRSANRMVWCVRGRQGYDGH